MLFPPLLPQEQPAPAFHLLDQQGQIVTLDQAKASASKGLILLFFASHFLPGDLNLLRAYAQAYPQLQTAEFEVLAISGLNWEKLYHLSQRLNLPYKVLFDPCCKISIKYKAMMIPKFVTGRAVYWIDPSGTIREASSSIRPQQILSQL